MGQGTPKDGPGSQVNSKTMPQAGMNMGQKALAYMNDILAIGKSVLPGTTKHERQRKDHEERWYEVYEAKLELHLIKKEDNPRAYTAKVKRFASCEARPVR